MDIKKIPIWLIVIFIAVLFFRLIIAFQTPYFSDDQSYFVLRQVEEIKITGLPLYSDNLSYSGRTLYFSPFFHYVLAFFNLFLPITLVGKLIPNILSSLVVFASYFVVLEITRNKKASLITAIMAGFMPIFIRETINTVSVFSLILPLLLAVIYSILKLESGNKYTLYLIIFMSLFVVTDTISFVVILGLIFFFFLGKTEDIKQNKTELEVILFSLFLYFWLNLIIFKRAFLLHGPALISQNIPSYLIVDYFSRLSILEAIYAIGIIPFTMGIFVVYDYIFKRKSRSIYLLISISLSSFLLLWFRFIPLTQGLMLTGIILIILSGQYLKSLIVFLSKSKFSKNQNLMIIALIFLVVLTSVLPSIIYAYNSFRNVPSSGDIDSFIWIRENTPPNSTILGNVYEGHLISYFSQRKNVADSNYLLIDNINQRIQDIRTIYSTPYKIDAIRLLNEYDVDYIYISQHTKDLYGIDNLKYASDDCFNLVYNKTNMIYKTLCIIE